MPTLPEELMGSLMIPWDPSSFVGSVAWFKGSVAWRRALMPFRHDLQDQYPIATNRASLSFFGKPTVAPFPSANSQSRCWFWMVFCWCANIGTAPGTVLMAPCRWPWQWLGVGVGGWGSLAWWNMAVSENGVLRYCQYWWQFGKNIAKYRLAKWI